MTDDLRNKFGSDEEYDDFLNSFNDYKNKSGMFEESQARKNLQIILEIEAMIYTNFILGNKNSFRIPDTIFGVKNMSVYMFYFKKLHTFDEVISLFLN